jgi:hypothetical protein
MAGTSESQTSGRISMEKFRSKIEPVIVALDEEIREYLSGAGPTRNRPRVNICAIARRAEVARTTFRASYHSDVRDRIEELKKKLKGGRAKSRKVKAPSKQKRTERPKRQDLLDQLGSVSQKLRESERGLHALKRQYESQQDPMAMIGELDDRQLVDLMTAALARRRAVRGG